jgi:hypothetical protein
MRIRSLVISATLISALVLALAVIALAADNPFVGTWKMNPAKSNGTNYKSYTIKVESRDNGFSAVQDIVNTEGKVIHATVMAKYDGKEYPLKGSPDADMMSFTKPDPNTVDYIVKKNGKEVQRGQAFISQDGKIWTDKGGGKDANEQAFTYTIIMEKQ